MCCVLSAYNLLARDREEIVSLLDALRQLWVDNSVFSTQLLASFAQVRSRKLLLICCCALSVLMLCAQDIESMSTSSEPLVADDGDRFNTVMVCFMLVARSVPNLGGSWCLKCDCCGLSALLLTPIPDC